MRDSELSKKGKGLARRISARLDEILAFDFPTDSPSLLAEIIRRIVTSIIDVLETTDDERVEKYACQSLEFIASHLRYIEGARSSRVPTSLVEPIEAIMNHLRIGSRVLVRVQHSYNYTVFDILSSYRRMFGQLIPSIETVLGDTRSFFIIAVPSVESPNILLHCLLAHELGHQIADKYLSSENQEELVQSIDGLIGEDLSWWDADIDKLPPLFKLPLRQKVFDSILEARKRALQELISDAVAYHLVGLNALFAIEEMSSSDVLDATPEGGSRWYPPWRYRIREIMKFLETDNTLDEIKQVSGAQPVETIRDHVITRLTALRAIAEDDSDVNIIQTNGILSRAYADIPKMMSGIRKFVATELPLLAFPFSSFSKDIGALLERLALGVPPDDIDGRLPDWRIALTAGWFYRVGRIPIPYSREGSWRTEDDDILCHLVLKAIESIQLVRQYRRKMTQG